MITLLGIKSLSTRVFTFSSVAKEQHIPPYLGPGGFYRVHNKLLESLKKYDFLFSSLRTDFSKSEKVGKIGQKEDFLLHFSYTKSRLFDQFYQLFQILKSQFSTKKKEKSDFFSDSESLLCPL